MSSSSAASASSAAASAASASASAREGRAIDERTPRIERAENERARRVRRDAYGYGARSRGGAFGAKMTVYADGAASGRASRAVEREIRARVLETYANTHSDSSWNGAQTSAFRAEARSLIAQGVNARVAYGDRHADVVTFAGSGSTSAIDRLCRILGLCSEISSDAPREARPVVFVGPHEHHSNILPWRESCALVVEIPEDAATGMVDVDALRAALRTYKAHATLIGSFSAASNVTGVRADVNLITETLHRGNALAFWDYAAAAPYVGIDMNPVVFDENGELNPYVYIDALFISPHKLPGGPGTPGILVAKRALFTNEVPSEPGGGTVFYVTSDDHRYLSNRVEREEGGTQDIIGSVRAGLAFQLKAAVGISVIEAAEEALQSRMFASLSSNENICLLGPEVSEKTKRLPIMSFLTRAPATVVRDGSMKSRFLHYSFTCAVLNDVFGIQARGGCACAGPYAHRLLGLSPEDAASIEAHLLDKAEVLRPGFVRVSLPYFASDAEIEYTLAAVHAVATHGWRLLPVYRMDAKTGEWRHVTRARSFPERKWLAHMKFPTVDDIAEEEAEVPSEEEIAVALSEQLRVGLRILETCGQYREGDQDVKMKNGQLRMPNTGGNASDESMMLAGGRDDDDLRLSYIGEDEDDLRRDAATSVERGDALRWFMFPSEAISLLQSALPEASVNGILPLTFVPKTGPIIGALKPPNMCGARESQPNAHGQSHRTESRKHPLRVNEQYGNIRTGYIQQRAAKLCAGESVTQKVSNQSGEPRSATQFESRLRDLRLENVVDSYDEIVKNTESEAFVANSPNERKLNEKSKPNKNKFFKPPPKIMRHINAALCDFEMIENGDRILLGLSGGKDSLAMLHIMLTVQSRCPPDRKFTLACATVDPGTEAFNPRPLIPYVQSLGVEYHYLDEKIMAMASEHMEGDSICAFCARMKRGALYTCARKHGFNKLILAQHLDDCVESFFMSTMYNGSMRTMKASYLIDEGDITVIRPAIYLREKLLRDFSYEAGLPVINENCPACFEAPKERNHIKKLLAREESVFPTLYSSMRNALRPLFDPAATDVLKMIGEAIDARNKWKGRAQEQRAATISTGKCKPNRTDAVAVTPQVDIDASDVNLSNASEAQLLAELTARRRERLRRVGKRADADDFVEKQLFCTAEGCQTE